MVLKVFKNNSWVGAGPSNADPEVEFRKVINGDYVFPDLTFQGQLRVFQFAGIQGVRILRFPQATAVAGNAFTSSSATEIHLPAATSFTGSVQGCTNLKTYRMPLNNSGIGTAFSNLPALEYLDGGNGSSSISANAFLNNTAIRTFIIRRTAVPTLTSGAFASSGIDSASDAKIFVRDNLVASYKSATNWSAYAAKIFPLSELVERT